jgi:hypothetical protein
VVTCCPFTAEARVRSQASSCWIFRGQSGTWSGFFSEYFCFSPVSVFPPLLHTVTHLSLNGTVTLDDVTVPLSDKHVLLTHLVTCSVWWYWGRYMYLERGCYTFREEMQSLYRSGHALRAQEVEAPRFKESAHEGGKVVSPTHRPPLPARKYSWYSFLLEAESAPGP